MIDITKEELLIAGKAINMQYKLEKEKNKYLIQEKIQKLKYAIDIDATINIKKIQTILNNSKINQFCDLSLKNEDNKYIYKSNNNVFEVNKIKLNTWITYEKPKITDPFNKIEKILIYSIKLKYQNLNLISTCSNQNFNKGHSPFEKRITYNIQKSFNLTKNIHKGKIYLMWINKKYENDSTALYKKDIRTKKYTISNMSNVKFPYTGNLSAVDIIAGIDNKPLKHNLNNKNTITWIKLIKSSKNSYFLLMTSVYSEDLNKSIDSAFLNFLPAALFSLFLSLLFAHFLFRRILRAINILTNTAKEVEKGNKNIRSHLKGDDDIGHLGIVFDSMLNSLENNIKTLDIKVKEKTQELQDSLDEKEILLKEIHHRVKNNLALTISLIKLQEAKIYDNKTKNILNNIQDRIYTMELIHRKLYESTNLNLISFQEYIPNLVKQISSTYNYDIQLKFNIDEIYLDIQVAMPCGLVLNEIITNSFKYAFNDNKINKLELSMRKINNKYHLSICDNGPGLDINLATASTLGLKLIYSISKLQLKGELIYSNEKYSKFSIIF